ncbi:hypothetical protein PTKIN_Ptkin19aG0124600 [Pterospermum kingtungense]
MATPQEKPAHHNNNETWPLRHDHDYNQDFEDSTVTSTGCGCINGLCWWRRSINERHNGYLLQAEEIRESWLKNKAKKLRELSEVLAGPRWKNFIRRFSINKKRRSSSMQFQYDPYSYELNFDEGIHREADAGFPDFSARFAAPAGIHKVELGRDKPSF